MQQENNLYVYASSNLQQREADAYLIAAAPDLLEACKAALDEFMSIRMPDEPPRIVQKAVVVQQLKLAIAKAESKKEV